MAFTKRKKILLVTGIIAITIDIPFSWFGIEFSPNMHRLRALIAFICFFMGFTAALGITKWANRERNKSRTGSQ